MQKDFLKLARGVSLATPTILFAVYEGMSPGDGGMLGSLRCSLYGILITLFFVCA